jgi:hypothetical protein
MGLGRKLKDWNAASEAFERERDSGPAAGSAGPRRSGVQRLAVVLKVAAVFVAVVGTLLGIAVGRSVEGWSRALWLAAPGWIVVLGAVAGALVLYGVAVGLACLDDLRRTAGSSPQ